MEAKNLSLFGDEAENKTDFLYEQEKERQKEREREKEENKNTRESNVLWAARVLSVR